MKPLMLALIAASLLLPLTACETQHVESSRTNWDGSHTTTDTTVTTNNVTGGVSVDKTKTTTR